MAKRQRIIEGTLEYGELLHPTDFLTFVELDGFYDDWQTLHLTDEDLYALQIGIMASPKAGRVVQGTSGLRKMRFAPERWKRGKRESARICYAYFEQHFLVILMMVYSKKEMVDLDEGDKKAITAYLRQANKWLAERHYH